ncbi:glycine--tRNA ligase subunit beta [Amylibacter sp. SFDW26]|uniref:glycine--tRNA ligase subunit beta n=1 Tax=Amylibacter sp. SFDW26 TaxID=2652722 RepID=UPI001262958B|nr:glycine--tRNA ligase subunit beta [Amylibacter sp. SFDW26]KAB7615521.1 glycine--tRNA ligase subunit beta [Amylibacter sp. SFDW26]
MADLLLELFSEEIPARMQVRAAEDLKKLVTDALVAAGLTYASAAGFSTPRRLCLTVEGLLAESPNLREERKGPRVDAPEKALEGFLRGVGLTKDQLEVRDDKKGQAYYAIIEKAGRPAADIIAEVVPNVVRNFPWPKSMRWGAGTLRWVRPLHSILCILSAEDGAEVVNFDVDGIEAANLTAGHRFHAPESFNVNSFDQYRAELKKSYVMLDASERADHIWEDAKNMAFAQGLEVVEDRGLLAEVSGLVEWPVVLMGDIAEDFVGLPVEVLQTSMKEHQKFFSVRNPKTGRIEKFITVANRETKDDGATILAGNQKVLFARLSDAKFFWENDLRVSLDDMAAKLSNVTFHNKLGTQAERIERIAELSGTIAPVVGADVELAVKAAQVAKGDLSSEMVYEFPELQGIMGKYYAEKAELDQSIANACEMHYSPLGPSDDVPSEAVSVSVALADKIDTLAGFWAIDEKPTGSKDPFALRRAALGVIRLILENSVRVNVSKWIDAELVRQKVFSDLNTDAEKHNFLETELLGEIAKRGIFGAALHALLDAVRNKGQEKFSGEQAWLDHLVEELPANCKNLLGFFHDRLKVYLRDKGISHDIIDACLAMPNNDDFVLLVKRAEALQAFVKTDDGTNLLQGFKRANNILTAEEKKDGVSYELDPEVKFAEDDAEKALFAALDVAQGATASAVKTEDFAAAMAAMASLRAPIDAFFEAVQVNSDNQMVRRNRLCLLNRIRVVMGQVADFGSIEG